MPTPSSVPPQAPLLLLSAVETAYAITPPVRPSAPKPRMAPPWSNRRSAVRMAGVQNAARCQPHRSQNAREPSSGVAMSIDKESSRARQERSATSSEP